VADLQNLKAGVSLALMDLSAERAAVVHRLNAAGIPVTAWLALPADQGYYFNAGNAPQAAARFAECENGRPHTACDGRRLASISSRPFRNSQHCSKATGGIARSK
jgi:hypothetical protein